jgi:parallel beta-helix repeat protein
MEGALIIVPDNYPTIQAAVENSSPHDLIYVRAGTYNESVYVGKPLKLIAEGGDQAVKLVKVNPTPEGGTCGFYIEADYVTIDGFEIADTNTGIDSPKGSFCRIVNNYIHDMTCTKECGGPGNLDGGFGICLGNLHGSSDYNLIASNVFDHILYQAIAVQGFPPTVVTGNMIAWNEIRNSGQGIHLTNAENCTISGNVLEYSKDWAIHLATYEEGVVSQNNLIAHNIIKHVIGGWGIGIYIDARQEEGRIVEKNNIHHNYIEDVQPGVTGFPDGRGIQMLGCLNLVHHNIVDNVVTPYHEEGTGNKVFKNSWQ